MTRELLFDRYFMVWSLFLPITSIILIPSIQGTTLGFLLSFISIFFVFLFRIKILYLKQWIAFLLIFGFFTLMSQAGMYLGGYSLKGITLVDSNDMTAFFRKSLLTQSLYLFAVMSALFFIVNYYRPSWDKHIMRGVILLVLYGFYEFFYFLLFHSNGDFLSNRVFEGGHSGSVFQIMNIGNFDIMRMKSLTGEPSMFAFTLLPFWIYSIHIGMKKTHYLLLSALMLSTSTTAIIGVVMYYLFRFLKYGLKDKVVFTYTAGVILITGLLWNVVSSIFYRMVIEKLKMQNNSGSERWDSFYSSMSFFTELHPINMLFGVGFGTIRATDFLSTMLVNCGIVGFIIFSFMFMLPVLKLGKGYTEMGLKSIIVIMYITMMISVSEFSYLPTWLFLGIAYYKVFEKRKQRNSLVTVS